MNFRHRPYNKGQWQVTRERFHLTDESPPAPDNTAPPIGSLIPEVFKNMKLDSHAQVARIAAAWPEIVGDPLTSNTLPIHLENKRLTVAVSHPGFIMELRGPMTTEILSRLHAKFSPREISSIHFTVNTEPFPPRKSCPTA